MEFVIILLLSVTGVEEIKVGTKGSSCETIAELWRKVNTTYYEGANQGHFTSGGELMIGHICQ